MKYYIFTKIIAFLFFTLFSSSLLAASIPNVVNQSPSEEFIGESFCFNADFSNLSADIGYGPYYLLRLDPDLTFQSATFSGLALDLVSNQTYTATGTLNDPISGSAFLGSENGSLVALTIPVGSVSSSQPALSVEICLAVDVNAVPDVLQSDALAVIPGFQFGDSATGVIGSDTIVGSAAVNDFTPTVIQYSVSDTQAETEHTPGPAWTYPITAIADIASTATVTPITFPTVTLPGNVKFTGLPTITGGVNCTLTPDAATLDATTGLGADVDINITCDSGTGTNGNAQDIRVDFDVYIVDTLDNMTCAITGAINTAKHLTLRKSAAGTGRPGSTITYTYAYQTSEFIPGINAFTVTDTLNDGISYSDVGGSFVRLTINHGVTNTTLDVPFVGIGTSASFSNADILTAIINAGGTVDAAESGTISYTTTIDQSYNNGDPVLTRDIITNNVTATYGISGAGNAQNCLETSSASVTIDDITISKSTIGSATVKPGDVVQFQLSMSVPSGDADNVILTDVLPLPVFTATDFPVFSGDLNTYPGSAAAGNFIEYAVGSAEPGNVTISRSAASNSINIDFGDISSATTQTIILNVYAKASAAPYADGLSLANLLNATTNNSAVHNTVTQILVRAPDVTITKEITSVTTNLDAGDEIDYRITIENQGGADAFDVTVTDVFGAALTAGNCTVPVLVGGSGTFTGTLAGGLVLDNTLGAANSGLGEAGSGNEIATLTFTCDINSGIAANTLVENTGQLTFAAGAGEAAFPVRESTVDVNTVTPNVVKTLVTTSESYSNTNELVVGEIARFRIVSTIPEGTHSTVSLSDLLPSQLIYQHDGSASLALVGSSITSSSFADPGGCTYTTTNANIVPDCAITAANAPFVAGDDPSFTLGTVTNSDSDADEELIVLELNAVKVDSGIAGTDFDNQARHTDITGSYDSATLALTRVEPVLTLDKAANNAGGDAGDAITYTLTITAPITTPSTAFDITLTDVLPAALNYVNASAAFGACDAGTTSFDDTDPNGAGISLSIDQLAANESCIFNYDANVSAAATPGQAITNTATLNWTSLDGTGSALSGSTPGTEKSYQAVDSATVTVDVTSSVKSIVSTSLTHTSEAGTGAGGSPRLLSIGEQINYRLLATVPEGSASNFVIRDNLPTGLEYVTASAAIALVSDGNLSSSLAGALCAGGTVAHPDPESSVTPDCAITPTLGASGNSVDFDIGNLTNTDADGDDEFIVIEFSALVKDQLSNQQVVNLSNQFEVLLGGVQNSLSNTMLAQIVEPQLSLTSSTTPNPVDNRTDETPTFAWALTLTNTGLAQAFQIQDGDSGNWQIQLPSGVENITALNVSTAGTVVDNTDLVTAINTAHFSVSGADNNLLSIDRTFAMAPSATLTITFNSTLKASVTPGSTLTTNTDVDYAGQQTGAPAQDVRNFADISTGTGNNPITSTSAPLNNYRTQTAVNVTTTTSTPVIGVAKELVSSTFDATDGSFDLVYRLHVENSGDVALTNIQLTDNLAATFNPIAAVNINVTSVTSADFTTTNGTFDGVVNRELIDNTVPSTLAIGQTKTLDIAVTVSPGTDLGTYNNSVTADGQSARDAGNTATDTSVDGDDPDPASDGPDNDTSVTPVTFAVNPELGLAKALNGPVVNNLNDTYSLNYRFIVKNTGNVDLANVQVIDDLATVFASADSFSVSLPTSGDFAINNAYNGDGDTNLLAANQTLAVGATGMVDLTVTITPGNTLGPYNNSATTTATSPNGNANDTSDNGSDPETNNGSGGFDDATPVTFTEAPAIGIAKAVTTGPINNGDGTHTLTYSMVVKNTGDISLTDVQVVDNLATTFNGATYTIDSTSATNGLTVNGAFDGNGDSNLLAASQNLTVDSSSTITLVVTVTPGNNLGAYNNSATASGSSQNGANANDTSDNGSDPETNNGSGGLNDTTPVTFVEAPAIGIAKAVTTGPSNNGDGTYTLTYSMVVKNTGDSDLTGVQVVDNLATTFNGATYTVDSTSATNGLTVNGAFDGNGDTNLLAASQGLSVGSDSTITLVVTVTPGNNLGAYNNSATASGTSPSGAGVNDTSDNGSDPETNNGSGGLDDATPVTFIEAPAIGAAKLVSSGPVNNGDGSYTLSYDIVVKNTGESDLTNVQVSDDLATTFSGASYAVTAISSADITVNASFNGDGDKNLLSNNQNLIVGARATITVALTVTPGANLGPYNNSATVSGTSPSGATVNDTSDAGSNPESNNGSGGFDDATPVSFNEAPAIGIAKTISAAPVNNNDGSYTLTYSMVVRNNGDIDLNTVQVIEDFAATYPAPASAVVDSLTSSSFTVNNSFNGYDDQNLLAANQTLATGASADLELTLTITPSTFLGPYNNTAKVNATSLSGAVIGDDSDDGIDPNGNNGSGGLNDPTPITFTEAPAIAIAKEISGAVTNNQDGSHSLLYSIVIRNSGDVPLNNVQVVEDLTTTFAGASFTVGTISSADLNVNPSFDGNADNNLLAASQSLAINTSAIILVPVIVTPMSSIGPFNNTAVATGDSPSGASVNDNSDNGDDPLSNNGSGGLNDPTPITFSEAPAIAIAKALLNFTNLGDGRYQIDYQFNSKNTGNIFLSNVQITEDLATIFNDTNSFSVLSLSSADLTVNNSFDGNGDTSLLAANQTLAAANTVTVDLSIIVTPGSDLGPYNNSVNVSATSPSGTSVNDDSDNGLDPETDNGDGGVDDVTPITFTEAPAIGIAKALVAEPINNNDGTYTLSYQLNVENIGDIALNNVQIVEDLSATFPAPATFVVDALSANNLSVNSDFDGVSDTNIFAASQSLAVGASDTITLTLTVTPGANLGPYNNSATASGTSPSGADVSDDSDNGSNTSGDNSEGTEDDPTPVTFTEAPAIAVAKAITNVTNNGDGTYTLGYQFNLKNTGDIALSNVQVSDNLFSTFQNQNIYTIVSLTSANLVVNNNFDGNADSNLLAANQNLAVSATDVIDLVLTITPAGNLGPYDNSAQASGTSPSGASVNDDSDNGLNPESDNGDGGVDDVTPITFTEAPAIGVAKTVSGDIAPTTNGTAGNFDVPFALMIENIGDVPLTNIQLVDDLASQFGDAYVGLSEAATITASTAQETPQLSPDFPANLFDGESGRLMPGENINISFTLELNPSSDDAKGLLTNQAQALGTSTGGQVVDDLSDSGANASDNADTGGDNPDAPGNTAGGTDDPTPFELPAGSLQGVVWLDGDRNDELNDGETLLIGWTVQVTDANGNVIATVLTDENGFFLVDNLPQGEYTVTFITPTGTTFTSKTVLVPANESVNIPVPVDPSGVVYDSITRIPVANSLVSILDENGVALPDVCLLPNQQHQITGDDGFYFFLLLLDADPACASGASFTLAVTAPEEQYQPSHSRLILPQDGALDPTGQPSPFALSHLATAPQIGDDTTYYMAFTLANGDPDVINNHIPVDQIGVNPHMIRLTKRADSKQTLIGGLVRYTVQVENISEVDVNNLTLVDQLPAGFSYVKNSIYTNDTDGQLQLNSVNPLSVSGIDVPAQESVDLVYILRVGAGVARGKHINRVSPFLGDAPIGNEATASVIVGADPDFEEVTILGKVFDDRDQDNWQDSANASAVFIQGGINAQHYIANSTRVIDSNGKGIISDASDDANNGAPLNRGIALGDLLGLSSVADHPHNHQIIVRQQLRELAFTDDLLLTTTEGSHISMNRHSEIQLNHQGEMQQGLNAQNLTIERTVTLLANGNYQVDLIIQNNGIQEIGIPGVRVATLDGIYVETDLHGRFHLEAVDVVNLARGRNFYMKVDQATLPPQSEFVSENPRVKRIAQGLPTRFDFAVQLAPEQLGGEEKHAVVKLGELLFNDNSATINSEHRTWLTQMADTINQYQGGQVQIIGQAHQQALAYERANNTYQALLPLIREDLRHAFSVDLMEEIDGAFAPMISLANVTKLGKVLFDTDKTTIKAQYAPLLDSIATQLVAAETGHLAITGFADSRASQDYNLALGLRRAKAVFGELKKRMPIAVWETLTIKIQKIDAETNTEVNNPKDANTEGK